MKREGVLRRPRRLRRPSGRPTRPSAVLMKLILAGEVDRLIAEALQSQLDGKRAVLRLLESQLEPGSSERGRVSMTSLAPSPAGQYYRRHLALGPWRAAQEAAACDAAEMTLLWTSIQLPPSASRLRNSLARLRVATNATIGRLRARPGTCAPSPRFRDFRHGCI
jgi:hypothetical protein